MQLIIIYGAEATGKLTIARELSALTSYRLFHNHVSIDIAKVFFRREQKEFSELLWDVRLLVMDRAAEHHVPGLIFTWAYSHPDFQPYLERIEALAARSNIDLCFVHVMCDEQERYARVGNEDRTQAGKINSAEGLNRQGLIKNYGLIPGKDNLSIDSTKLPPIAAARAIAERFAIPSS